MNRFQRDALLRRMTTPPPNQETQPPRTSYDAFTDVFSDLKNDGEAQVQTNAERAKELWDASNPDV